MCVGLAARRCRTLVLCLLPIGLAWSPTAAAAADSRWSLRVFAGEGLPEKYVAGITQTPDGWLWVATPRHLARFDGVRFEPFHVETWAGVSRRIRGVVPSHEGGLWLPTDDGPIIHVRREGARLVSDGVPKLRVEDMVQDGQGALWVAYRGGVLCHTREEPGRGAVMVPAPGLPPEGIHAYLGVDRGGRVWVVKGGRVGVFEGAGYRHVATVQHSLSSLGAARSGGVWLAVGQRLFRCDEAGRLEDHGTLPPEHRRSRVTVVREDRSGAVWIGTSFSGLVRYHEGRFENVPTSHPTVVTLFEDRETTLWVGTGGGGLNRIERRAVVLEGTEGGLPGEQVRSLAEDAAGVLWGATPSGQVVFRDGQGWRPLAGSGDWLQGAATTVAADRSGALFIGTRDDKLHRWEKGRVATWGRAEGLEMHAICAMAADGQGDLWIAGESPTRVQRLSAGTLRVVELPPDTRPVRTMVEDPDGSVWMGAAHGVLLRAKDGALIDETGRAPGGDFLIRSLHVSADGTLWIGYDDGGGLGRLKDGRFAKLAAAQGLPQQTVIAIFSASDGRLWIVTEAGILRLSQKQIEDVAEGRTPRVQSVLGRLDAAMPSLPALSCGGTGAVRARDGRTFVPLGSVLAVVDPERETDDVGPPPVAITRVAIDGKTAAFDTGVMPLRVAGEASDLHRSRVVQVPPQHRRLEVDVTALSLRAPENVRFRYRLEGLEDDWTEDAGRRLSYSRLPAGRYRLRVLARGSGGTWNESGTSLDIVIHPFVWQTWWFRVAALLALGGTLAAVVRFVSLRQMRARLAETERQAALDRERTRIARDIHDEVGNQLTRITLLSALSLRDLGTPAGPAGEHVAEIAVAVREVTDSLDEIVWAVNPGHDTLPHVANRLAHFAIEYLRTAEIACRLQVPDTPPPLPISAEVRHNLFLAFKEAMTNAVRHSRATMVEVTVSLDGGALQVVVRDDGCGFAHAPSDPMADGLRNMRQRIEDIGGRMELTSAPGAGTRVAFILAQ